MLNYQRSKLVRDAMADWINKYDWDFWMTGTFKEEMRVTDTFKAKKLFMRFIKVLGEKCGDIDFFMAVERFKSGEFTHIHCVLNGVSHLRYLEVWELWFKQYGRAVVAGYDRNLGAHHYLTKYVVKELCDWDFKIGLSQSGKLFKGV
jgi:hypothetical protein